MCCSRRRWVWLQNSTESLGFHACTPGSEPVSSYRSRTNLAPLTGSGIQPSAGNFPCPLGFENGSSSGLANAQPWWSSTPGLVCCHVGCTIDTSIASCRPCRPRHTIARSALTTSSQALTYDRIHGPCQNGISHLQVPHSETSIGPWACI